MDDKYIYIYGKHAVIEALTFRPDIITEVLKNNPKVLKTPEAEVSVKNLTDSSIQLAVRPWANNEDFWGVYADTLENCKLAFDAAGHNLNLP